MTTATASTTATTFKNVPGLWNAQLKSNDGPSTCGNCPVTAAQITRHVATTKSNRLSRTRVEAIVA